MKSKKRAYFSFILIAMIILPFIGYYVAIGSLIEAIWLTLMEFSLIAFVLTYGSIFTKSEKKNEKKDQKTEFKAYYRLKWSYLWQKKWLKKLNLSNHEQLYSFLQKPDQWLPFLVKLGILCEGTKWFENAFNSIRWCSKGLFEARFLDHALVSVPPPITLFTQILDSLKKKFIVGLAAPSGWGKSRLVLWIALSYNLKKWKIYYFPDPSEFDEEENQKFLLEILQNKKILVIIDDYHLRNLKSELFWKKVRRRVWDYQNTLLILQTVTAETREIISWPGEIFIISAAEYENYWYPEWKQRFITWFKGLNHTPIKNFIYIDHLSEAENAENPWAFVSVCVNLKELIKVKFSIKEQPDLVILLNLIILGFVVHTEVGLTPEEIYNGLRWIHKNEKGKWKQVERLGGLFWSFVIKGDKEKFINYLIVKIKEWRQPPRDSTEIRLLPSEGGKPGPKVPIKALHVGWWKYALKLLWESDPDWSNLKHVKEFCELSIIHASPSINANWFKDSIDEKISILKNCNQLQELYLSGIRVKDISVLGTCKNLEKIILGGVQISNINSLNNCTKLKTIDLNWCRKISDLNPLKSCKDLEFLLLNRTAISDLNSLQNCKSLQILYLNRTKISNNSLETLKHLKNLQVLRLSGTKVSNIFPLGNLEKLHILDLSYTKIENLKLLEFCTELQELHLNQTNISDLSGIEFCHNLQMLDISRTKITNINKLFSLKKLRILFHTHDNLPDLTTKLPKLQVINKKMMTKEKIRVLISSLGLDEPDQGVWLLAKELSDAGMIPFYIGLTQSANQILKAVIKNNINVLGLVILSSEYKNLIHDVMKLLKKNNLNNIIVCVGGTMLEEDKKIFRNEGITGIFEPGSDINDVIKFIINSVIRQKLS